MTLPSRRDRRGGASRRRLLALGLVSVVALAAGCGGSGEPPRDEPAVTTAERTAPRYPRTAAVFLAQDRLPPAATLAGYDVVVIDNEWAHRMAPSFFESVRARNPEVRLLAYVNVTDRPLELGSEGYWANRYALWRFTSGSTSAFPERWLAAAADGAVLSEYAGTQMTNLTDVGPLVEGQHFGSNAVAWMVERVMASKAWDGIFLDVWGDRVFGASREDWDPDRDGKDEPGSEIYGPGRPWERGIDAAERMLRARLPDAVLVANAPRTFRAGQLDGRTWESFADDRAGRDPGADLRDYVKGASDPAHRLPGLQITIDRRTGAGRLTADELRRARFFLTATLLQNGYWAGVGSGGGSGDYDELVSYDELTGGGIGRGYLGRAVVASPTWSRLRGGFHDGAGRTSGVYRRDFENGTVLHNPGDEAKEVDLGGEYRHIDGRQDPAVNDGSAVSRVTVPARDGLILLRVGPPPP